MDWDHLETLLFPQFSSPDIPTSNLLPVGPVWLLALAHLPAEANFHFFCPHWWAVALSPPGIAVGRCWGVSKPGLGELPPCPNRCCATARLITSWKGHFFPLLASMPAERTPVSVKSLTGLPWLCWAETFHISTILLNVRCSLVSYCCSPKLDPSATWTKPEIR